MKPFHTKYRPAEWEDMVGQDAIVDSIRDTIPSTHFYILYGMRGTGKTTAARLIANALGCEGHGLITINAATRNKVEHARQIEEDCIYMPLEGPVSVYLFDEAHRLTVDAQNVILTILEEQPPHVYFIFCTTNNTKFLPEVIDRAANYEFKAVSYRDISVILDKVCQKEDIVLQPEAYKMIVDGSEGIPRRALVLLDQIKGLDELEKIKEIILLGSEEEKTIRDLCRLVYKKGNWMEITTTLNKLKDDPERIRRAILGYLSKVLLNSNQPTPFIVSMMQHFLVPFYDTGKPGLVQAIGKAYAIRG